MTTTARARAEYDYRVDGPAIHLSPLPGVALSFNTERRSYEPEGVTVDVEPLRLDQETARALYEALADYFGGTGHDTRALRRDYDAERKRVDLFIAALTTKPSA